MTIAEEDFELTQYEDYGEDLVARSRDIFSVCYNSSTPSATCNPIGPRFLEWNLTTLKSCPFDSSMCIDETAVRLDSGIKNSLRDLGKLLR